MTFVNLNPSSTGSNTGAVTGSSAHAALSDSSDSTFVDYDYGEASILGLTDLSLPSGAVLLSAQAWVRVRKDGTGPGALKTILAADVSKQDTVSVTWETAADVGGVAAYSVTDAGLDAATLGLACNSLSSLRVYKAWVRVLYLAKPTVSVTAPSGTVTSNAFWVNWTPTFDVHAQRPGRAVVKVFSQAQYSAGGFNPETSTPTLVGEKTDGSVGFWFEDGLPDGNYRAYVQVASPSMPDQRSDWDYEAFTMDVDKPGVPSLTVTGDDANGRVEIVVDDTSGAASTDRFQLQWSVDGVNFMDVLTVLGDGLVATSGTAVTVYDYEAPNGVTVTYRARAFNASVPSWSGWATSTGGWSAPGVEWLKCLLDPSLNLDLAFKSYPGFDEAANQGVFRGLGSETAIVVSDVPGPESGTVVVFSKSDADRAALKALRRSGSPILMQVPGHPDRVVVFGDRSSTRIVDTASQQWHEETLPWTVVDRPDGPLA